MLVSFLFTCAAFVMAFALAFAGPFVVRGIGAFIQWLGANLRIAGVLVLALAFFAVWAAVYRLYVSDQANHHSEKV